MKTPKQLAEKMCEIIKDFEYPTGDENKIFDDVDIFEASIKGIIRAILGEMRVIYSRNHQESPAFAVEAVMPIKIYNELWDNVKNASDNTN